MENTEILYSEARKLPFSKTVGCYVVDFDGYIFGANDKFRELLKIKSDSNLRQINIKDFYFNKDDRKKVIDTVISNESKDISLERQNIKFSIEGERVYFQVFCQTIRNTNNEIIGFFGWLDILPEEESYKELYNELPAGIYKLDKDDKLINVNQPIVEFLGYKKVDEILGKNINDFYVDTNDADIFKKELINNKHITNKTVELKTRLGKKIYTKVNAYAKFDENGEYAGREGTIVDITEEEHLKQILQKVPLGIYNVEINDEDKAIITNCNDAFLRIFKFKSKEDALGKDIMELWMDPDAYFEFENELLSLEERDETKGIIIKAKDQNNLPIDIKVYTRLIKNVNGKITGRTGAIRNITKEALMENIVNDIGNVLHDYSALLLMLKHSIIPNLNFLKPDPFETLKPFDISEANKVLDKQSEILKKSLDNFIDYNLKADFPSTMSLYNQEFLDNKEFLDIYKNKIPFKELWFPSLNECSLRIRNTITKLKKDNNVKFSQEKIKELELKTKELQKQCCLISLHKAIDNIYEMSDQVSNLREFVIFSILKQEPLEKKHILNILKQSVSNLSEYSTHKNVKIKPIYNNKDTQGIVVNVNERNVIRALVNLLHNAIKYSWKRSNDAWVSIKIINLNNKEVCIDFENYGVPIRKEEILYDKIFQPVYRGIESGDRGRQGTGIGLPDSRNTARLYGGDVTVISLPADKYLHHDYNLSDDKLPNDEIYKKPFITNVTFILPIYDIIS